MSAYTSAGNRNIDLSKIVRLPQSSTLWTAAAVLAMFSALWFIAATPAEGDRALQLVPSENSSSPQLSVSSVRASRRYGFVSVVGEVKNVEIRSLGTVEAVVELLDQKRSVLGVESALIGTRDLAVGQSAPFTVSLRDAAGASSFRIRFRVFMGRALTAAQTAP